MHCTPIGYQWAPLGPDHTWPQGIIVTGSGRLVIVQTTLLKRKQWSQILETHVKKLLPDKAWMACESKGKRFCAGYDCCLVSPWFLQAVAKPCFPKAASRSVFRKPTKRGGSSHIALKLSKANTTPKESITISQRCPRCIK